MSAREKLDRLLQTGRRSGRTYAAVQGCLATGATLIVHSHRFAQQLKSQYPELNVMASDPEKLLGLHKPVLVDHYLYELLIDQMGASYMEAIRKLSENQ